MNKLLVLLLCIMCCLSFASADWGYVGNNATLFGTYQNETSYYPVVSANISIFSPFGSNIVGSASMNKNGTMFHYVYAPEIVGVYAYIVTFYNTSLQVEGVASSSFSAVAPTILNLEATSEPVSIDLTECPTRSVPQTLLFGGLALFAFTLIGFGIANKQGWFTIFGCLLGILIGIGLTGCTPIIAIFITVIMIFGMLVTAQQPWF